MGDRTTASAHEVISVEPVIRRVVAARAANPADIDDLVQDCLERLLVARERLSAEAVLPYAVVVARNLVSSQAKSAMRHAAAAPRIVDTSEPDRPEDVLLAGETRAALMTALAQLSAQERQDVLAYYSDAPSAAGAHPVQATASAGAGAVAVVVAVTRPATGSGSLAPWSAMPPPVPHWPE